MNAEGEGPGPRPTEGEGGGAGATEAQATHPGAEPRSEGRITLTHPVPPPEGKYQWVYLWQWPIRAMHWVAAICIVALVITGFYIGAPYFTTWGEASDFYVMGGMRFIHFAAAGVLVATGIVRIYWLFVGNRFERWPALFPFRKRDWVNLFRMMKHYAMIEKEKAPKYLGHNPIQQLSYTTTYVVTFLMVITGFILYGQHDPSGIFYAAFYWMAPWFGGIQMVRFIHHILTWWFLIFLPMHIYFALRVDVMEREGAISSIMSGGRFVPVDEEFEDG